MSRLDNSQLAAVLEKSGLNIAILLSAHPHFDAVASALGLKLALERANHHPSVACVTPMTVEFHRLVGADTIATDFGSRNLIISFPGQTESVDKVSYNVDGGDLQLVVTPKPGAVLDHTRLKFIPGQSSASVVILVGVKDLADLGKIYTTGREAIDGSDQFWLDGPIVSQVATQLLTHLRLPLDADIATNLLAGLEVATNSYQAHTTAEVFEAAAYLLRQGARRQEAVKPTDFPAGSIPTNQLVIDQSPVAAAPAAPEPDWYAPKIYRGTTIS